MKWLKRLGCAAIVGGPLLFVGWCAIALYTLGGGDDYVLKDPVSPDRIAMLESFDEFPAYWLGAQYATMDATSISVGASGANQYTFVAYGKCKGHGFEAWCGPPLAIKTSRPCGFQYWSLSPSILATRPDYIAVDPAGSARAVVIVELQGGLSSDVDPADLIVANSDRLAKPRLVRIDRMVALQLKAQCDGGSAQPTPVSPPIVR